MSDDMHAVYANRAALAVAAICAAAAWWVENNVINMFRADEYR